MCHCFHAYKSVAPLKLRYNRGVAQGLARFHAYKSVAPLKLACMARAQGSAQGFHAYKSVAPLKHVAGDDRHARGRSFHAYKSVAPLKLERHVFQPRWSREFPRLQKRGPIEARLPQAAHGW